MKENNINNNENQVTTFEEEKVTQLVLDDDDSIQRIELSAPINHASIGERIQFTAFVGMAQASARDRSASVAANINWSSSNPAVATVDNNGEIEITGIGQSIITARTNDGDVAMMAVYGTLADGVYQLHNAGSHKYATVSSTQIFDSTEVYQYTGSSTNEAQWWKIKHVGDGKYSIRSYLNTRMGIKLTSASATSIVADLIGQTDSACSLNTMSCWTITTEGSYYTIKNCSNGKALAAPAGNTNDGINLQTLSYVSGSSATNQRWYLPKISNVPEKVVVFDQGRDIYLTHDFTLTMEIGDYRTLCASYKSPNSINQLFAWTSSNPNVASPIDGKGVCVYSSGSTTITVTSDANNRKSFSFHIIVPNDSDYDGIYDSDDSTDTSGVISGTLASYDSSGNVEYSLNNAQYCVDYRNFVQDPTVFNSQLCQLSAIVSTIIYERRKFNNEDIDDWMNKHGMLGAVNGSYRIDITGSDDHLSEIALGYRPVVYDGKKRLVVAVIIRGTNGTIQEWSSNMDIGNTDTYHTEWTNENNHMGFDITAFRILLKVQTFVAKIQARFSGFEIAYWVTGHSRGGALANLVAAKLINYRNCVFAYTFAAPATTDCAESIAHAAKYNSIFNIVNEDDFIPYFPLENWEFKRYGRTGRVHISGQYEEEWKNSVGEKYNWDKYGLTDAFDSFIKAAPTRNSCYQFNRLDENALTYIDLPWTELQDKFPSNTVGYYEANYTGSNAIVYQSPMFLMKFFAYLACDSSFLEELDFALNYNHIAPYLHDSKTQLVQTVLGGIEHPHYPQTYYILAKHISSNDFLE